MNPRVSNFASNLVSLARSKLHSTLSSGTRDNLSMHRWVLLRNSIKQDQTPSNQLLTTNPSSPEEEVEDFFLEDDVFSFLFPDPGDSSVENEGKANEAQWFDALMESLGDDDDVYSDTSSQVSLLPVEDAETSCPSYTPSFTEYPIPYPPFHPPLLKTVELDSGYYSPTVHSLSLFQTESPMSPVPDAVEDTSDDDSEAPATPYSGSRSSLSIIYPPIDHPDGAMQEPYVYSPVDTALYNPFGRDALPYADLEDSVYNPDRHSC